MKIRLWISLGCIVGMASIGVAARSDDAKAGTVKSQEAVGLITDTGYGSFSLNEKGTVRQFSLSASNSRYEPAIWRPAKGDQVSVTFTPIPRKDGSVVLTVDKAALVKAGPDTVTDLKSPVVVDVVEVGRLGLTGKVATGQSLEFSFQHDMKRVPPGWVIAAGDKVSIDFKPTIRPFSFGITLAVVSIEKQPSGK